MPNEEEISAAFLENDRIWPPSIGAQRNHPFITALIEVLKRLPEDVYDVVEGVASFVVADPHIAAVNVPFERVYPPAPKGIKLRFDSIVFFESALSFPRKALLGLIAHELAHSLQSIPDYEADEREADALVVHWGFRDELQALRDAQKARREAEKSDSVYS